MWRGIVRSRALLHVHSDLNRGISIKRSEPPWQIYWPVAVFERSETLALIDCTVRLANSSSARNYVGFSQWSRQSKYKIKNPT